MTHLAALTVLLAIAVIPAAADAPLIHNYIAYNTGYYGRVPQQSYHSINITSPLWQINLWNKEAIDPAPYIFAALPEVWTVFGDQDGADRYGPYIFSAEDLSLVYADPTWELAKGTRVQQYNGSSYLTFWAGVQVDKGHGNGSCYMLNSAYEIEHIINTVDAPTGADLHECQLTSDGTALIIAYYTIPYDLTPIGGPADGELTDCILQEVDIATGKLLFQWRALDHYSLNDTWIRYSSSDNVSRVDYFHLNSIQKTAESNYLISALNVASIAYINGSNGDVIWTLGGQANMFTEPNNDGATTFISHDARFRDDDLTQLTLYDNHVLTFQVNCAVNCTRGKHLEIDHERRTATIVKEYFHPQSIQGGPEGNYDVLSNGNVLLGWGAMPTITEHNATTGDAVLDIQFAIWKIGPDNYRTYKDQWVGKPTWGPAIASTWDDSADSGVIYVSWNGATEVKSWALTLGESSEEVDRVIPKVGFETAIPVNSTIEFARVLAIGASGKVLGSTDMIETKTGSVVVADRGAL